MPIKVIKYTCGFKCGHKAMANIKMMEAHENNHCFKNPENKTCATCINAIYENEHEEYSTWYGRGCKVAILNEFLEEVQEDLKVEPSGHIKPLWHCPNHNKYNEQEETKYFIAEVKAKIEAKKLSIEESKVDITDKLPF